MKYYTCRALETEPPYSEWCLTIRIDEAALTSTLSHVSGGKPALGRIDTYMLAIGIIHQKTRDFLKAATEGRPLRFSSFELAQPNGGQGVAFYDKGGLAISVSGPVKK